MPLFVCSTDTCRSIDNTALTMFWSEHGTGKARCSKCASGTWHGRWQRSVYDAEAPIGSDANPERLWVDGEWVNTPPRRTGHHTAEGWVYDDGFGHHRPYTWVDGVPVWNDELGQADKQECSSPSSANA